uniref:Secreted peptide n=1 Tax=Pyxicephalus adspersus TaxID=30357 RepID=A0AAV3A6E2_PYXAD|nr:TPA: hypothetical protein GDO54_014743 [Pyxicephalus adspersus]
MVHMLVIGLLLSLCAHLAPWVGFCNIPLPGPVFVVVFWQLLWWPFGFQGWLIAGLCCSHRSLICSCFSLGPVHRILTPG